MYTISTLLKLDLERLFGINLRVLLVVLVTKRTQLKNMYFVFY